MNLKNPEVKELMNLYAAVITELQERNIVRTQNNPLGDYTEWLVARALDLELQTNSKTGYDGISKSGQRFQIKGRRFTAKDKEDVPAVVKRSGWMVVYKDWFQGLVV